MEDNTIRQTDLLAVGLTKPAKVLGVPLMPYYLNCMACFLGGMLATSLTQQGIQMAILFLSLFSIIHVAMVILVMKDSYGLTLFYMNLTQFSRHASYNRWNYTDSFSA